MKLARVVDRRPGAVKTPMAGIVMEDHIDIIPEVADLLDLLTAGPEAMLDAASGARRSGRGLDLELAEFLSPISTPPTVRDFYAFEQHVRAGRQWRGLEMDSDWYQLPVFYFSNPYAVRGCGEVPMPPGSSQFDFELEVAAIIGSFGSNLTPAAGQSLIVGYCVMNDWSARDVQQREMKISMGPVKGKDTATSLGPWLVTPDELADVKTDTGYALRMSCTVNGVRYSDALWSDVYWSFGEMIAYASRGTEVRPGDVFGSGTCATGCIMELSRTLGEQQYPWLHVGDRVSASVERLGSLECVVTSAAPVVELRGPHQQTVGS